MVSYYLAVDLGAESGRVILGHLEKGRLSLEEIHRFPNRVIFVNNSRRWDILRLFDEIKTGLKLAGRRGLKIRSVSTDSWGVDYVLLKDNEPLLSAPYQYRDARTDGGLERLFALVPKEEVFEETGIQFMSINTLYQFHDDVVRRKKILETADGFLNIGDYFNYLLSGRRAAEESLASTTQIYNPRTRGWSEKLISKLGIPKHIFPEIVPSGTRLGKMSPEVAGECSLEGVEVIATCSHDTGSAVAAVPGSGENWAYLSSGTWSLLGVESPKPLINARSRELNFTNEAGYGGTTRFLKNIVGLWVVQECRRYWTEQGVEHGYDELTRMSEESEPLRSLIDLEDPRFGKPGNMPQKISEYCRETNQPLPSGPGDFVRAALESLALLYRLKLTELEEISGEKISRLHIVGGGSKNRLLNQLAANATGCSVVAGPVEATAIGNILIQAIALGDLKSLVELREVVRNSFPVETFEPREQAAWAAAMKKFAQLRLKAGS